MKKAQSSTSFLMSLAALLLVGLACGSKTPPPQQYVGVWTGEDGTSITIQGDGSADYRSGSSSINGGSVTIDESAKTLKVSFASMGPTFTIDKAPAGDRMTLSGVVFKRMGGGDSKDADKNDKDKNVAAQVPSEEKLQTLVKTTLFDFGDAVQEGDFTDFHKKIAEVWRDETSPEELNKAFAPFIEKKEIYNFKKGIAPLDAKFSPVPAIEKVADLDALVVRGVYPTKPQQTQFELKYTQEDDQWKLIGINVKVKN
jgi:hypothetical protein